MKNLITLLLLVFTSLVVNAQTTQVETKPEYKVQNENEYSNYKNCGDCIDTENWTSVSASSNEKHSSSNSYDTPKRKGIFRNDGIVSEEVSKTKRIVWGAISSAVTIGLLALIGNSTSH